MMPEGANRKDRHIEICLDEPIEFRSGDGFAALRFDHDALPQVNKDDICLEATLFGKRLSAPLIIGAMTGGTPRAGEINRRLALAAERTGVGFALGSQRPMVEDPGRTPSFAVRAHAPGLRLLLGNIGAVQLNYGVGADEVNALIAAVECDAFNFHLNPLQEAIQPEGNTNFAGLLERLKEVTPLLSVPVLLKEVGAGISETTAAKIATLPVAGVETAGIGGTSWSAIESHRTSDPLQRSIGQRFAQWGVPTPESIVACRRAMPDRIVIASGGMRNGIEAAKALALGADAVAFALPMLKAAERSLDDAVQEIQRVIEELRTVMFLTGCPNVPQLRTRVLRSAADLTSLE
ncbi:MAG: type 2 isopentenyl-diphosphate Delta-isomerase [Acidobacteriota bacterium]